MSEQQQEKPGAIAVSSNFVMRPEAPPAMAELYDVPVNNLPKCIAATRRGHVAVVSVDMPGHAARLEH